MTELHLLAIVFGLLLIVDFLDDGLAFLFPALARVRLTPPLELGASDDALLIQQLEGQGFVRFGLQRERVLVFPAVRTHALVDVARGVYANVGQGKWKLFFLLSVFPGGPSVLTSNRPGKDRSGPRHLHQFVPGDRRLAVRKHLEAVERLAEKHGRPVAEADLGRRAEAARHAYCGPLRLTREPGFQIRFAIFLLGLCSFAGAIIHWQWA